MPAVLLIAAVWIAVVALVVGLCQATSQSEAQPVAAPRRQHAARVPLVAVEPRDERAAIHARTPARSPRQSPALATRRVA